MDRGMSAGGSRSRPAFGARALVAGASVAATVSLMAGMAWAAQHEAAAAPSQPADQFHQGSTTVLPGLQPTQAPPVTSSNGS